MELKVIKLVPISMVGMKAFGQIMWVQCPMFKFLPNKTVSWLACWPEEDNQLYRSMSHISSSHLGFVHPLQDVALHQCLPSSSVYCLPNPGGSLLLCYVILPSSAWSSSSLSLAATLCIALSHIQIINGE